MTHPAGDGWGRHVAAHVDFSQRADRRWQAARLRPGDGAGQRAGFLILTVADRAEAEAEIAADSFTVAGLIETLAIVE